MFLIFEIKKNWEKMRPKTFGNSSMKFRNFAPKSKPGAKEISLKDRKWKFGKKSKFWSIMEFLSKVEILWTIYNLVNN